MPLHVLIAGAGLAGLAAAIALGREGHQVDLYEKSSFSSEIGAAFHFGPYAMRILKRWGVDTQAMDPVVCEKWQVLDCESMKTTWLRFILSEKQKQLNVEEDEIMLHRVDGHRVLREHALAMPNVKLHLGDGVQSVDPAGGIITLTSGSQHKGDVIVGADGVHSKTVQFIDPSDYPETRASGINMYRFMLDAEEARRDPEVAKLLDDVGFPETHNTIIHPRTRHSMTMYSCRGGRAVNCATFQLAAKDKNQLSEGSYTDPGSIDDVLEILDAWPAPYKALARQGHDVKHWAVVARDVPKTYHNGRLILLGDAAHPTQPTHAAGANMGIEDAAVLGVILSREASEEDLQQRLDIYSKLRYPRTVTIKFASEMIALHEDTKHKAEQLLQEKAPNAKLPTDVDEFLWTFDAMKDAQNSLAELR